jgi:hypothetical protein
MDLIERIFRISPDQGSGVLEAALLLVVSMIPIAAAVVRSRLERCAVSKMKGSDYAGDK